MKLTTLLPLMLCIASGAASAASSATTYSIPAALTTSAFNCTLSSGVYNCPNMSLSKATVLNLTSNVSIKVTGNFDASKELTTTNNGYTLDVYATGAVSLQKEVDVKMNLRSGGSMSIAKDAIIDGNLTVGGSLSIAKDGVINGDVTVAGAMSVASGTVINGNCTVAGGSNYTCKSSSTALHHVRLSHNGSGVTCTGSYITINACSDADASGSCSTSSTTVSGTAYARTAAGVLLDSTPFTVTNGATRVTLDVTSPQTAVFSIGGLSVSPTNSATCWNTTSGTASCNHTYTDSALIFSVPDHVANVTQTIEVSAVRKSDNGLFCAPGFEDVTRAVTFSCSYGNPTTGTRAPRINGQALNSANSPTQSCDAGGRAVNLAFDETGVASTTVQYSDAGRVTLSASYPTANMTGSASFIAAPSSFAVAVTTAAPIKAGASFGATVTAQHFVASPSDGTTTTTTPNFGRESTPETVTLTFTQCSPVIGSQDAYAGVFSGTLGSFSNAAASATNLQFSEVGNGNVTATLSDNNYLGSGINVTGTTGTGAGNPCTGVGPFIPSYFETAITPMQVYTYSGQPISSVTVVPRNASGAITNNFNGTTGYSKDVTLSPYYIDATNTLVAAPASIGALSGATVAASAFKPVTGASATPTFTFAAPASATATKPIPRAITLRAENTTIGVSSLGQTEAAANIRFGRLKVYNAVGSGKQSLQVPVQAEYWSGKSWLINTDDSKTLIPTASVALNRSSGLVGSSVSAPLTLSGGKGYLTLTTPTSGKGYIDMALNLGSTAADQSCLATHPATTGAAIPWLRSLNGSLNSCSQTFDRDPSSRATFGVYSPETQAVVHVRESFN
ncbi:polymer-forming cytoskeletal protein [Pseudoduganella namucuonensis]|uniref:MSHA biogenesis protein MshQ n=1 Tax=Pseudoduganella namucuonensis TaxID=1035707 RepID=A0A1I7L623_9BURK|nr:polymer-forming cytoskeletal protein [Pseudoduganella namucuonensis]SFV05065.1 MSHA biogenesis protein MshQ [Pseudoduganella namucuonensis]